MSLRQPLLQYDTQYDVKANSLVENSIMSQQQAMHQLQLQFQALQSKLLNDVILFAEYQALQKSQLAENEKSFMTPLFRSEIYEPYKNLVQQYQSLRAQIAEHMNPDELNQIEASVMADVIRNSKYEKRYFPAYQKLHEEAVEKYSVVLQGEIEQLKQSQISLHDQYQAKKSNFETAYLFSMVFFPLGVGMLVLIGTIVANAIAKLSLVKQTASNNKAIKQKELDIANQVNPNADELEAGIRRHPGMLMRQSIFTVNKSRQALATLDGFSQPALTLVK